MAMAAEVEKQMLTHAESCLFVLKAHHAGHIPVLRVCANAIRAGARRKLAYFDSTIICTLLGAASQTVSAGRWVVGGGARGNLQLLRQTDFQACSCCTLLQWTACAITRMYYLLPC